MQNINKILDQFIRKRILIVGEISCFGQKHSASAALTAILASKLGAIVTLAGTIGPDVAGSQIISELRDNKIAIDGINIDPLNATPDWQSLKKAEETKPYNMITEKQIINAALKQAHHARSILYFCPNPNNFSSALFKELHKISKGLKIPLTVLGNYLSALKGQKPVDLMIIHQTENLKLSKDMCRRSAAKECLVINKNEEVNLIDKNSIKHFKLKKPIESYQYEAAISALATLMMACHNYPAGLPQIFSSLTIDKNLSVGVPAMASSQ